MPDNLTDLLREIVGDCEFALEVIDSRFRIVNAAEKATAALALAEQQQAENERLTREKDDAVRAAFNAERHGASQAKLIGELKVERLDALMRFGIATSQRDAAQAEAARLREALVEARAANVALAYDESRSWRGQYAAVVDRIDAALSDAAAPAKDAPHAPTEAEAADLGRPKEDAC